MRRILLAVTLTLLAFAASAEGDYPFDPVGTWRIAHGDGTPILITARADGGATSDWEKGEEGTWRFEGARLHFAWSDGWHDFIYREGEGFAKVAYGPGSPLSGPPTNRTTAEKVK